jgi:hypothetical protein
MIALFFLIFPNVSRFSTLQLVSGQDHQTKRLNCGLEIPARVRESKGFFESSASTAGVAAIPSQFKVTQQILLHWQPFRDLKFKIVGSRRPEQLNLRSQQRIVDTVEESVLRMEMSGLESQEEDTPKCVLFFKPMSWLRQIRPHRRDES